jgi:hypothetical protein
MAAGQAQLTEENARICWRYVSAMLNMMVTLILCQDVAKFVREVYISQAASMHFSMMSLGPVA